MGKLIDLTGQRFGRLTVIKKDAERKTKTGSYWICQCDCGKVKSIRSASLRDGSIQSCGCFRKEYLSKLKTEDLTGLKFGKLTVLTQSINRTNDNRIKWTCQCECGNIVDVNAKDLKSFHTTSCGCIRTSIGEQLINAILTENNIKFISQYRFPDLKNRIFDFAIFNPNNKLVQLIEYDGEQHFVNVDYFRDNLQDIQKRDQEKNEYAKNHNIPLVRIPYTEKKKITLEKILTDEVRKDYGKL